MRIDNFLTEKGFFVSRNKAKESIERGEVFLNGKVILKSSYSVIEDDFDKITVQHKVSDFVSIGGFKLEKALEDFSFDVKDLICADIGASTGGFTDCLIKHGAKKVYAVDLNDSLLSEKLKINSVVPVVKNARLLTEHDFDEKIDLITADLSFISETLVLPVFSNILQHGKHAIILIKPQFESDRKIKYKNGIVDDDAAVLSAIKKIISCAAENGLQPIKITDAPKKKGKNREYLVLLEKSENLFDLENFYKFIKL
ncbi:MAG: TlyA family RNA methyltransferase [Clostridia bacterium]|nr:TlyA family RNA methyltransferase [Clostridia bacterium]